MLREALRNLNEFIGRVFTIPWSPSEDWPHVRLRATREALRRIRTYRRERRDQIGAAHRRTRTLPWRHHG